jgi:hypothetical protein
MALATRLIDALEQNGTDSTAVPLPYNYRDEFAHIIAEGLGIPPAITAKGLGIRGGRCPHQNRGRGGRPPQLPEPQHPTNTQQASRQQPAPRPISPTPLGFEHNCGPAFIPFHIQENSHEVLAHYIQAHLDMPNPFVEGRLSLDGPTYHSEIHTASVHNVDIPPPPITAELLQLLQTGYMGHDRVDEALSEIGDWSLIAKVNRYRWLERKHKTFQESITQLEDQMFTTDVEHRMCISRLEGARALVRIQEEMQRNRQPFCLSPWSVEHGCLP